MANGTADRHCRVGKLLNIFIEEPFIMSKNYHRECEKKGGADAPPIACCVSPPAYFAPIASGTALAGDGTSNVALPVA